MEYSKTLEVREKLFDVQITSTWPRSIKGRWAKNSHN